MSRLTDFLKLHIWEIPKDNNEKFNYTKAIADNFDKIDKGMKNAVSKFTEPLSYKGSVLNYENLPIINTNGDIYTVTSENKNYIWNGTTWEEYSSNIDLTPIEEQLKTTQITEVAEELSIPNTAPVNGKLDIKSGKSEQETRSGKNKLYIDSGITSQGITTILNEDGSLSVSGKANNTYANLTDFIPCSFSKGTYTYSIDNVIGTNVILRFYDNNNSTLNSYYIGSNNNSVTISLNGNEAYYRLLIPTAVDSEYIFTIYPQLEEGTEATEFEPYGASPSPDYPSDIRNVGDNINLANISEENHTEEINSATIKNSTITFSKNGYTRDVTMYTGTNIGVGDYFKISNLVIGEAYTINYEDDGNFTNIRLYKKDKSTELKRLEGEYTFVAEEHEVYFRTWTTAGVKATLSKVQLKKGSTLIGYSEYGCGSVGLRAENGGNIFNPLKAIICTISNWETTTIPNTTNNTSVTIDENYCLTGTASSYLVLVCPFKFIKGRTIYNKGYAGITIYDNNGKNISLGDNNTYTPSTTFEGYLGIRIEKNAKTDGKYVVFTYNNEISYTPYQEQRVAFPLSKGQLLHKGDYLAEDGIHQVRKTYVITGKESWALDSAADKTNTSLFNLNTVIDENMKLATDDTQHIICNSFITLASYSKDQESIYLNPSSYLRIRINKDRLTSSTSTNFKAYLQEQYANGTPVTVEYELAEEIVTPYTEEQKEAYYQLQHLLMYEGYTSIECIDEIKPDIQVEYSYNNEINTTYGKKIDTLEARIRQLEQMITSQSEVVE